MSRSWRDRPTGSHLARLWRPWVSLNPLRQRGRRINEPKSVGIRDLVNPTEQVRQRPERRWRIIGAFFSALLLLLIGRLFMLQILEYHSSTATVQATALRTSTIAAPRGLIVDRAGHALVVDQSVTEIQLSRAQAALDPSIKGLLASVTGVSLKMINSALTNVQYSPYQPAPIMHNAPQNVIEFIKLHPSEFPGVTVVSTTQRSYPYGSSTASQLLGYVGDINGSEIAANPQAGYQTNSKIGKSGVESVYEKYLRGRDGAATIEVNALGETIGVLHTTAPKIGNSLVLNVDAGLQKALDSDLTQGILRTRRTIDPRSGRYPPAINGAAIVLDPNSGAVLALSSYPSYNLSSFINGLSQSTFNHLLSEGAFNNYAISGVYTPGSTFKMISATAQLQSGIFPAYRYVNDTGSFKVPGCLQGNHGCVFHDDEASGAGMVNLPLALTKSSDYYFYNLGYLFWSHTGHYGLTPIQDVAAKYGLSEPTNIDLPNESTGRVDSPTVRKALHAQAPKAFQNFNWYTGDNVEMAFGQGLTAITPIGLANAYATFANGGTRYQPEIAAGVMNADGKVIQRYSPHVLGHVALPPSIHDPILQGLRGVVDSQSGTGYYTFHTVAHFSLKKFPIAGKTGTASNAPGQEPNSWFVGFGPLPHPKYVVLCVIGEGGYGASAAAPVVANVFNYLVAQPVKPVSFKPVQQIPTSTTLKTTTTTVSPKKSG